MRFIVFCSETLAEKSQAQKDTLLKINIYTNNLKKSTASSIKNPIKTGYSACPPVLINPVDVFFQGQKGVIPSRVKLSAAKCDAYPKKKGSASTGIKNAKIIEKIMQTVKL